MATLELDGWGNVYTPEETPEKECAYCGEPCEKRYCNSDCKKAYESEN
jgi:hypothetical protein